MDSIRMAEVLALLLIIAASVQGDFVEPLQPFSTQRSLTETLTRLPCHYEVMDEQKLVQVSWNKKLPDGSNDPIIMAHFTEGLTVFGRYSGRVKFENNNPTVNSALLVPKTQVSDEGSYTCHISTYPNGNFERSIDLTVWSAPISDVDATNLVDGQPYGVVASCRAVGRPAPQLSWDTDLPGHSQSRIGESGSVFSEYSLHPLRSMNGKKLDCLVSHPSLEKPRRISHRLVVQYPPDPSISSPSGHWYVGLEKAELVCQGRGYPEPQNITWTRRGGALPDGVSVSGERLTFGRALRMNDSGIYECMVRNAAGAGKTEYTLTISEKSKRIEELSPEHTWLIIVGAAAGVLVLMLVVAVLLVRRYHRNKTRNLQYELKEKTEQLFSFSKQNSVGLLSSYCSSIRIQDDEYIMARLDSRNRNSRMSVDRIAKKGSQSTLNGKCGVVEECERDEYGRPALLIDEMESMTVAEMVEEEDRKKWTESYVKMIQIDSNASVDSGHPASLDPPKVQQNDCIGPRELNLLGGDSPPVNSWVPERCEDSDSNHSYQISKCIRNHFDYCDGNFRPKPRSNAILMSPTPIMI